MTFRRVLLIGSLLTACWPYTFAGAEVSSSAAGGFVTRHSVRVAATRAELYRAFVDDVGKWWDAERTVSGNPAGLYIDARAQGCFCEVLGADAGFVHLTVTFVNPQVMLRFTGGLGPIGLLGATGNMTIEFVDADAGTDVVVEYAVGGFAPEGLDTLAPDVGRRPSRCRYPPKGVRRARRGARRVVAGSIGV